MTLSAVERARRRVVVHRAVMLVRFVTAGLALLLLATVGLFGHLVGLTLPARLAVVSTGVVIALLARLERPQPKMPGLLHRRPTPLRRSATWVSWFTLIFLLAIRVPSGLVMAAALLPILGVHINTSQTALTPAARRTALIAPLVGHLGLMTAVFGVFGQAPWWAAGIGLWLAGLILAARLSVTAWLATRSRAGHHAPVLRWLRSWTGGLVDDATLCHALVLAGDVEAARRVQPNLQPYVSTSIRHAVAFASVEAATGADCHGTFTWMTRRFPSKPHGPLGLSDALLAKGEPAADWARLAQDLAGTSLWSHGLLEIADANLARAYAQSNDPRAQDVLDVALDTVRDEPQSIGPAALHRLVVAAEESGYSAHDELVQGARASDPGGLIGAKIRRGEPPVSVWL